MVLLSIHHGPYLLSHYLLSDRDLEGLSTNIMWTSLRWREKICYMIGENLVLAYLRPSRSLSVIIGPTILGNYSTYLGIVVAYNYSTYLGIVLYLDYPYLTRDNFPGLSGLPA